MNTEAIRAKFEDWFSENYRRNLLHFSAYCKCERAYKEGYQQAVKDMDGKNYAESYVSNLKNERSEAISEIAELTKQRDELKAENEKLRGIKPSLESTQWPLPRYGIKWNGPKDPLAVPMEDGYWTPFHLAEALSTQEANKDG